ncbi:homoserine dehydrogenase [Silicimonas algicola]|uniref:Putative homoserine dehydrogenase-like protein n=1 Tax=Silicimonas algicola TaxID=1826607 RepID=A0A316FVN5_9RHOB|nr:Gfo/Idh/MocA family oxidoreductase [Silicimonas algicola]AZQ67627.1 homoserine dehydrogenase [Silicimonas algicola]PWK51660.1 putative homoserine dehydrogenase-like protein [Silicimonas algicola]
MTYSLVPDATPLPTRLARLERPIAVCVVGIGSIGNGLAYQLHHTPGFKLAGIADINLEKALKCAERLGLSYRVVESAKELAESQVAGDVAVSADGALIAGMEDADVMIEASNAVIGGARHAEAAISSGNHVVMMNYEAELMYGPHLLQRARAAGLIYTCADGDQPTVIKTLVDEIVFWGFEPVMLGNMKGFHDLYSDPTKIAPEADKRNLDHKMCASYTDGSKLGVEMAVVANALGGRVARPGMTGPRIASIHNIFEAFDFTAMWQPGDAPIVDYVLGARPVGGVFVIGHTPEEFQQFTLSWYPPDMGPGPFYLFYRPYHLGHIEALRCVAEAVLDSTARLAPWTGLRTNVVCYAKRDLKAGDVLDGMGGYLTYGFVENLDEADSLGGEGVPQLICDGLELKREIKKDARILMSDCAARPDDERFSLYRDSLVIGAKATA